MNKLQRKLIRVSRDLIHLPQSNAKHFSFICERNKILAIGYNNGFKTHPQSKKFGHRFYATHSELSAICSFGGRVSELAGLTFYNIRLLKSGEPAMSRPCSSCQGLLASFGVRKLFYTNYLGNFVPFSF